MDAVTPELSVTISPHASIPKGTKEDVLKDAADFVLEVLFAYLPDEYPLDGASQTEIRLGTSGDDPRYARKGNKSVVYVDKFDFKAWKKTKVADRQEFLLEQLSGTIDRIAHAFRGDRRALKEAVKKVKNSNFSARIAESGLSLDPPDLAVQVEVFREVSPNGEDWGVEVLGPAGKVVKREWIKKGVDSEKARELFKKSRCKKGEFALLDSKGKATFTLSLTDPVAA
jgi:hypothetical protein